MSNTCNFGPVLACLSNTIKLVSINNVSALSSPSGHYGLHLKRVISLLTNPTEYSSFFDLLNNHQRSMIRTAELYYIYTFLIKTYQNITKLI